jgi:pyrroloquinoline quinone biosynthesis protein B
LEAVLLTNADLDHTLGLLSLREGDHLHLHASKAVRDHLSKSLAFTSLLTAFCGVTWHLPSTDEWSPLLLKSDEPSGLLYQAISLASPPPLFGSSEGNPLEQTLAFLFKDERTGGVLLVAPDVFEITKELLDAVQNSDAVLFDGTFWSEDELELIKPASRPASAMGHLPIITGSLPVLTEISARHRVYVHINNTNPILMPESPERMVVEGAGITIGHDGLEFEV